jgi:chorismate dehydratase
MNESAHAPAPESMSQLRLGLVPYLNILPLVEGLGAFVPADRWVRATPRELGSLLSAGEIDLATLPMAEILRNGTYRVLSGCAIASNGPVRSVQIFSKVPLSEVRSVLLDRSSLTSVCLARIVLRDLLGIAPSESTSDEPLRPSFDWQTAEADAFLVIGDTALEWEHAFPHKLDLGSAWKSLTGLPFVYAAWAVRANVRIEADAAAAFVQCRKLGQANVARLAAEWEGHSGLTRSSLEGYLRESIRYELGEAEISGIEEFRRRLVMHELVPPGTQPIRMLWAPNAPAPVTQC